jgi:hypothetical protein
MAPVKAASTKNVQQKRHNETQQHSKSYGALEQRKLKVRNVDKATVTV